jgi:hypothetical protein
MQRKKKSLIDSEKLCRIGFIGLVILFILSGAQLSAQDKSDSSGTLQEIRKNSFYFEFLGNGVVYSLNYERIFPVKRKLALFARVGGNEYHPDESDELSFNFLAEAGILVGGIKSFFETGLGYTHFTGSPDRLAILTTGYRYQGLRGLVIRVTPMYIYNSEKGDTFGNSLWFGASIGYAF